MLSYIVLGLSHSIAFGSIKIGWAASDITPSEPTLLRGQFYARFSEGVLDPLSVTALAIESADAMPVRVIMVSCDMVTVPDYLRNRVRELVTTKIPALDPTDIILNATHTHTAPLMGATSITKQYGLPYEWFTRGEANMSPKEYYEFTAERISEAVIQAWEDRKEGGISYGLSKAVIGHNRLQVDKRGKAKMYGDTGRPEFSHIEGYEDHDLNLLYTWDRSGKLTGIVINAAVPAQVSGQLYQVSADFWTETRALLREEIQQDLFILPQVSAAGDQSPYSMWGGPAEERMQKLMGSQQEEVGRNTIGRRKQIARHITEGVKIILPYMKDNIEWSPVFAQKTAVIPLSRRTVGTISEAMLEEARREVPERKAVFDKMLADIVAHPEKRTGNRWYRDITTAYSHYNRARRVYNRYKNIDKEDPKFPVEIKIIRIGDMAIATNPFELYLDYGIQIKANSPAVQTFLVELTGSGSYVPTQRSIDGGAYGSAPASTTVGPEGGAELVNKTLEMIRSLWN